MSDSTYIVPGLEVYVRWSKRLYKISNKRFGGLFPFEEDAEPRPIDEELKQQYDAWTQTKETATQQIQRLFQLTGNLPAIGDQLHMPSQINSPFDALFIQKRIFFTTPESANFTIIYTLEGEEED